MKYIQSTLTIALIALVPACQVEVTPDEDMSVETKGHADDGAHLQAEQQQDARAELFDTSIDLPMWVGDPTYRVGTHGMIDLSERKREDDNPTNIPMPPAQPTIEQMQTDMLLTTHGDQLADLPQVNCDARVSADMTVEGPYITVMWDDGCHGDRGAHIVMEGDVWTLHEEHGDRGYVDVHRVPGQSWGIMRVTAEIGGTPTAFTSVVSFDSAGDAILDSARSVVSYAE